MLELTDEELSELEKRMEERICSICPDTGDHNQQLYKVMMQAAFQTIVMTICEYEQMRLERSGQDLPKVSE